jgi:hypothetical protein
MVYQGSSLSLFFTTPNGKYGLGPATSAFKEMFTTTDHAVPAGSSLEGLEAAFHRERDRLHPKDSHGARRDPGDSSQSTASFDYATSFYYATGVSRRSSTVASPRRITGTFVRNSSLKVKHPESCTNEKDEGQVAHGYEVLEGKLRREPGSPILLRIEFKTDPPMQSVGIAFCRAGVYIFNGKHEVTERFLGQGRRDEDRDKDDAMKIEISTTEDGLFFVKVIPDLHPEKITLFQTRLSSKPSSNGNVTFNIKNGLGQLSDSDVAKSRQSSFGDVRSLSLDSHGFFVCFMVAMPEHTLKTDVSNLRRTIEEYGTGRPREGVSYPGITVIG